MKLSERIAKGERMFEDGCISATEFDSWVESSVKQDAEERKENAARYHVAISNNTKGPYAYGTTDHYVDTAQEVEELHTEWFEQDTIAAVHFLRLDGVEISNATKTINGGRVVTVFATQDRQFKK